MGAMDANDADASAGSIQHDFLRSEISGYEEAVLRIRAAPEMRQTVEAEYLDASLDAAAARFAVGDELRCILHLLRDGGVGPGARVLDLGGGRGILSAELAAHGYAPILCEISRSSICGLGALRDRPIAFRPVCADFNNIGIADETFDAVVCKQVLHHAENPDRCISEAHRVLKPGGYFLAYKEHSLPWYGGKRRFLRQHPATEYGAQEGAFRAIRYWRGLRRSRFHAVRVVDILTLDQLRDAYGGTGVRARLVTAPLVGSIIMRLLHLKYSIWMFWFCQPGIPFSYVGRKRESGA